MRAWRCLFDLAVAAGEEEHLVCFGGRSGTVSLPTLQPANFGRVQAAYSGFFLLLALLWGWGVDKIRPDKFDIIGSAVAFLGMLIIMYAPRDS